MGVASVGWLRTARLLDIARDSGLVRIEIGHPGLIDVDLAAHVGGAARIPVVLHLGQLPVDHLLAAGDGLGRHSLLRGGLKEGFVKVSPYGKAVSEGARKNADAVKAKMVKGDFVIFRGPLKDNAGKTVIASGAQEVQTDVVLEQMNYLVEGVVGKV
jgi:hypothetical protein